MNRIKNLDYKQQSRKKRRQSKRSAKVDKMLSAKSSKQTAKQTSPTRTEKKLAAFKGVINEDPYNDNSYILIQKKQLLELLVNQICKVCQQETVSVSFSAPSGFAHKISLMCETCGKSLKEVYSSIRIEDSRRQPFHVNKKLVEAMVLMGLGYAGLQRFCLAVDISIISRYSFNSLLQKLSLEYEKYKFAALEAARQKVREYYISMEPKWKSDSQIDLICSYDGSYQKRGYTSLYGIGTVIDIFTGLVIDFEIISKFCKQCSVKSNSLSAEDFNDWYVSHMAKNECQKNFNGPSTAMETYAAEVLWKRSVEVCNARYMTILSDGDAKVFSHLNALKVYGPDVHLQKEECVNHVCKRLTTALRNARKDYAIKGITLGGKKGGALTDKVISDLGGFYRNAIVKYAPHVHLMQSAILAPLEHYSSTDEVPTHQLCPAGEDSWCWYNKTCATGHEPGSHKNKKAKLNKTVIEYIRPIYERLSTYELLERCVRGGTQNSNESLHHLIWNQSPKERFQSKKKLEMAVTVAVSEFNMGCQVSTQMRHEVQRETSSSDIHKVAVARDQQRLRVSHNIAHASTSRALKKRRSTKVAQEESCYAPGAY